MARRRKKNDPFGAVIALFTLMLAYYVIMGGLAVLLTLAVVATIIAVCRAIKRHADRRPRPATTFHPLAPAIPTCPRCGGIRPTSARFCPRCGAIQGARLTAFPRIVT